MAVYTFGNFELDTRTGELRRHASRVRLRPQPCAALVYLIERPGQFVCRQELHRALWPEGTFVRFEDGLNSCVKQIRAALGDSRTTPRYLETLTRRGYRFIAPVAAVPDRHGADTHGRVRIRLLPVRDLDAVSYGSGPNAGPGAGANAGASASRALADGLGEELIARLAVAAPREMAVVAEGLALGDAAGPDAGDLPIAADYALATSIRAAGAHARVTAQLIDTRTRQHIWAGRFDLSLDEPLDAQAAVAEPIVRGVVAAIRNNVEDEETAMGAMGRLERVGRMDGGSSGHRAEGVTTHGA
jgi:DNA-binding winged helix-turn-helix (wHTH) protein/TolB-like protein